VLLEHRTLAVDDADADGARAVLLGHPDDADRRVVLPVRWVRSPDLARADLRALPSVTWDFFDAAGKQWVRNDYDRGKLDAPVSDLTEEP
jgi:hypothetical protein